MKAFFDWLTVKGRAARLLYAGCALGLLAELVYRFAGDSYGHPHFGYEEWFGFSAGWGFVTFALLILSAHALGAVTRRGEDYYDEPDRTPGGDGDDGLGGHATTGKGDARAAD